MGARPTSSHKMLDARLGARPMSSWTYGVQSEHINSSSSKSGSLNCAIAFYSKKLLSVCARYFDQQFQRFWTSHSCPPPKSWNCAVVFPTSEFPVSLWFPFFALRLLFCRLDNVSISAHEFRDASRSETVGSKMQWVESWKLSSSNAACLFTTVTGGFISGFEFSFKMVHVSTSELKI